MAEVGTLPVASPPNEPSYLGGKSGRTPARAHGGSELKDTVRDLIYRRGAQFIGLAHDIHEHPQLAFAEAFAAARITDFLAGEGFAIRRGLGDLPTAFVATIGRGRLHVAFCAEYDALASDFLVQQTYEGAPRAIAASSAPSRSDDSPGPNLHACGHNLIAGASVAAVVGLRDQVDDLDLTVSLIGTPGEELIGLKDPPTGHLVEGKIVLLEAGAFEGVHAALMVHPGPTPYGGFMPAKAGLRMRARFSRPIGGTTGLGGVEASRLDEALRHALLPLRLAPSYCKVEPEGTDRTARVDLFIVARSLAEIEGVRRSVRHCLERAASTSGVSVDLTEYSPFAEMCNDPALAAAYSRNAKVLGRVRGQQPTIREEVRRTFESPLLPLRLRLAYRLFPRLVIGGLFADKPPVEAIYGTDLGNVSQVLPAIHPGMGIGGIAPGHSREFAAQADSEEAYRMMLDGGVALAWTAIDAATDPAARAHLFEAATRRAGRSSDRAATGRGRSRAS